MIVNRVNHPDHVAPVSEQPKFNFSVPPQFPSNTPNEWSQRYAEMEVPVAREWMRPYHGWQYILTLHETLEDWDQRELHVDIWDDVTIHCGRCRSCLREWMQSNPIPETREAFAEWAKTMRDYFAANCRLAT